MTLEECAKILKEHEGELCMYCGLGELVLEDDGYLRCDRCGMEHIVMFDGTLSYEMYSE